MADNDSPAYASDRRTLLRTIGAAGAVGLAGCAGDDASSGGTTETSGESSGETSTSGGTTGSSSSETVKVGWLYPSTGPYGGLATYQEQGAKLAIKRINENGGIDGTQIEGFHEDTQADPQTGTQKARKLVQQDGVDALFGCISSSVGSAVAGYAAEENVPFYPDVAADGLTMENCQRTTFRYETRASQTAAAGAPWAVDNFGTKVWIHNADYLWGNSVASAWEKTAKDHNSSVEVVGSTTSELGATDFSSYISQIMSSDAEWVVTGLNGGDAVNFLKQSNSYGLKSEKTLVSPVNSFQFIRKAAGEAAQNTYSAIRYYEGFESDANSEFVQAFTDEYASAPDNFSHVSWVYMYLYKRAAEKAGSFATDDIVEAQTAVSLDGPMGTTSYRECDHQAARPYSMGEIVAPGDYDWPDIEVMTTIEADEATVPCSSVSCQL
ncbi:ABC transporter substrate-binding protein [Halogeometricum limi]|uniref:Branched-chain amino acid transport system substrate-binding protein n=1 Tax=Halogeometricum limi TaxID=555875 RepID=A0A1I6IB72_9EURY|nr:ABC transporter substrate-binding protein [Halogeometricum limi]SFR63992.1 branched-chain amino acid transport system substrate-binding protein [Halogeometricum limi]